MKFLLDFDDVLFDTARLKKKMDELGLSEAERNEDLFAVIAERDPAFSLKALVYPDARNFLEQHARECIIVSSAASKDPDKNPNEEEQLAYQLQKILLSELTDIVGEDNVKVVAESKTEILQEIQEACNEKGEACVFVDNRVEHVEQARELGIEAFLMDRSASGLFEKAPSLNEGRLTDFEQFTMLLESRELKEAA